jgi:hypothetical protein
MLCMTWNPKPYAHEKIPIINKLREMSKCVNWNLYLVFSFHCLGYLFKYNIFPTLQLLELSLNIIFI